MKASPILPASSFAGFTRIYGVSASRVLPLHWEQDDTSIGCNRALVAFLLKS